MLTCVFRTHNKYFINNKYLLQNINFQSLINWHNFLNKIFTFKFLSFLTCVQVNISFKKSKLLSFDQSKWLIYFFLLEDQYKPHSKDKTSTKCLRHFYHSVFLLLSIVHQTILIDLFVFSWRFLAWLISFCFNSCTIIYIVKSFLWWLFSFWHMDA